MSVENTKAKETVVETPVTGLEKGSRVRIVEGAYVRTIRTRRIILAASEEVGFSRDDVLLIHTRRGDVHARSMTDSSRQALDVRDYAKVMRRLQPGEIGPVLGREQAREKEAREVFIREVRRHKLDMRLSQVEASHGDNRIVFYFTAPGRVDFRGLVRDLAVALHSRIELRQIGVRDEARCAGGIGPCGRTLCCSSFLTDFFAVTIKMAKAQGLVLNPQKVSGLCGRLMCCIAYEYEMYRDMRKGFPKVGSRVMTPKGEARVKELQIMRGRVKVSLGPGEFEEFAIDELEKRPQGNEEKRASDSKKRTDQRGAKPRQEREKGKRH